MIKTVNIKHNKKNIVFLWIFLFFLILLNSLVIFYEIRKIQAQDASTRKIISDGWPKISIQDGNYAQVYPAFRNDSSKWYYTWEYNGSKRLHAYFAGGEIDNMYGTLKKVESKKAGVTKKEIKNNYINGSYQSSEKNELLGNQVDLNNSQSRIAVLDLDFYDRVEGSLSYDDWVKENFANKTLIINGNKVSFGNDPANGPYANLTVKEADPDNDGFWAPFGGLNDDDNDTKGGGNGGVERDFDSGDGDCYPKKPQDVRCDYCEPKISGYSNWDEAYAALQSHMYGYGTLTKCYYSLNNCGSINPRTLEDLSGSFVHSEADPEGSKTSIQHENYVFGGLGSVGDPDSFDPVSYGGPSSEFATRTLPYDNGKTVNFHYDWCFPWPFYRNDIKILGPTCENGETGIVTKRILLRGADDEIIYDSNIEHPDLFPMECVPGTESSNWKYQIPINDGELFDLTNGEIEVEVYNPYALVGDVSTLDNEGRWGTFFGGYISQRGPEEFPENYKSRCGELEQKEGIITGKVDPVFCEHYFPHVKDSQTGKYYITGNYLDVTGDGIVEDMFQDRPAFTNYEEFVWGTDPLTPNTNTNSNEIYTDEMNIAGVAKDKLEIPDDYNLDKKDLNVDVEGITGISIDNYDRDFWIGHANTNKETGNSSQDFSVEIRPYSQGGPWTTPAVGQVVDFLAEIQSDGNSDLVSRLDFTWSAEVIPEGGNMNNIKEVLSYSGKGVNKFMFQIDELGTYLVKVKVSDGEKRTVFDDYEFIVNAGYTLSYYTAAVQGDVVEVKVTNTQNINPAAYVWTFEDQKVENNSDTFKFIAYKGVGDSHNVYLRIVNANNSTENLEVNINIPVVAAKVNFIPVQGWDLKAGSTEEGYYKKDEEVIIKGLPGPVGSTWDDKNKKYEYSWSATGIENYNNVEYSKGNIVTLGSILEGFSKITVSAKTNDLNGNYQISPSNTLILKESKVAGVLSGSAGLIKKYWWLFILIFAGLSCGWYYKKRKKNIKKIKFSPNNI